jgi:release factor glutamine methyltransferase
MAGSQKVTAAQALRYGTIPAFERALLLRHVLSVSPAQLAAHPEAELGSEQFERYRRLLDRRTAGEPIAYLVGSREFYSLDFKVSPAVLIPRPETELLVDFALERIDAPERCAVLDLGTGSGCVAIAIARHRPRAHIVGCDASAQALAIARENAASLAAVNVELLQSDWYAGLGARKFEIVVANPPYVAETDPHLTEGDLPFEPAAALLGGADGLACIRQIVAGARAHLHTQGWLAFEHGYGQAGACRELLAAAGLSQVFSRSDLAGIERVSGGCWNPREAIRP